MVIGYTYFLDSSFYVLKKIVLIGSFEYKNSYMERLKGWNETASIYTNFLDRATVFSLQYLEMIIVLPTKKV